jgi:nucleoside-diphosphate-sugar epimerase
LLRALSQQKDSDQLGSQGQFPCLPYSDSVGRDSNGAVWVMGNMIAGLRGQKVLVTGASGFIGRRLVAALIKAGATVTALGRGRHSAAALAGLQVRMISGDMADPQAMAMAVAGQRVIFNLAYDFRASGQANVDGLNCLLMAAQSARCGRIVHASSIVVYDDWPGGAIAETSPMNRPYRHAKIAMERRLMAGPLPAAILQPTIVYGPGSSMWTDGFAEALRSGAVVLPDPEGLCQGVFVDDVVQGMLLAAVVPDLRQERFILNGPAPFKWSDLVGGYRDILGRGEVRFRPSAELAPAVAHADEVPSEVEQGPSAAARISALGRRVLGRERFEGLVRAVKRRLKPGGEMRPDAHLYELYTASGDSPPDLARQKLGYAPQYDLAKGLAATAEHLRGLMG